MRIYNYCLSLILLSIASIVSGCFGFDASVNDATATTQARRAIDLATRVSSQLRQTQAAERQVVLATAQAAETLLLEARSWPVILQDTFDGSQIDWAIGDEAEPELASISWSIADGVYHWQAECISSFVWWVTPTQPDTIDFYLAARLRQSEGSEFGEYGLVFRRNEDDEYYLFELSNNGSYAIFMHTLEGWDTIVDWTSTSLVQPGEYHLVEITGRGSTFYIDINGQRFTMFEDDRLPFGQAGLLVGLSEAGSTGVWEFDDFLIRAPETSTSTPTP